VSDVPELTVGEQAPDFETVDDANHKVKLSDLRGRRVVLYFYPKDDTAGCTAQACGFRDNYAAVEEKNAVVLGVSPDDVASHQAFKNKHDLNFPLLVDPEHKIAEAYGVWGERSFQGRTYMGVNRSHFVIDEDGKLVDVQYGVRPTDSVEKALEALA
jgi:thioredoxin-dependent peroxiredoxin